MSHARASTVYSAKYYDASPTWYRWNKLSAADVFQLRKEPGFAGQNIWFWLNHPIQYVRLVGFICQMDLVAGGKYILMTLDDGSGANIELKLERLKAGAPREDGFTDYLPRTTLADVSVAVDMGLPVVWLRRAVLELGTVVVAEGQIESYMQGRQMLLERLRRVPDTRAESQHWAKVAEWKRSVLAQPWILSDEQRLRLDQKTAEDERRALKQQRHHTKHRARRKLVDEVREKKRHADESEMNRGALPGSEKLRMPWEC